MFYFGGVGGGVWKTSNAGVTWEPIFDKQPISSIGALVVAPSDPNIIYVGTGEADFRSNLTYGIGVYKSTNGGKTWKNIGLTNSRHISPHRCRSAQSGSRFRGGHGQRLRPRRGARHFSIE